MGLSKRPSFAAFAIAFVVHVLAGLVTRVAHGAEAATVVPAGAAAHAAATREARVVASRTTVSPEAGTGARPVTFRTRYVLSATDAADIRAGVEAGREGREVREISRVIRFAVPLPEGARLDAGPEVAPEVDGAGRVVGVWFTPAALDGRALDVACVQRVRLEVPGALCVPIAAGTATQIVDGALPGGARLDVAPQGVLEDHVGLVASSGASPSAREEAKRLTGHHDRVSGHAIYIRGDDVRAMGGLVGSATTQRDAARGSFAAIAAIFAVAVGGLLFAMRRLGQAASVERADALLLAEIEREAR